MIFYSPLFFLLLPLVLAAAYYAHKKMRPAGVIFPSKEPLAHIPVSFRVRLRRNLFILRVIALCAVIFALARPRMPVQESSIKTKGIAIVIALDVSTSMRAEDFTLFGHRASRIDVVKDVVKKFIMGRRNDRIGIVAFAARAYTVSPLTLDYNWLLENLKRVKIGMIEDGTAIGLGLASSLNRLKDVKAKSKVVILLTDGRNNAGDISPSLAAEAAKALGIKVYTIGAGTKGMAPYPVKDFFGNIVYRPIKIDIDEGLLKDIARKTGGKYFRATDTASLRKIYADINKMEKTTIVEKGYLRYNELFGIFLSIGFICLLLEEILRYTLLRAIP